MFDITRLQRRLLSKADRPKIDILIYPPIKMLNKKGYTTKFCCSGHTQPNKKLKNDIVYSNEFKKCASGYITFEKNCSPSFCESFSNIIFVTHRSQNFDDISIRWYISKPNAIKIMKTCKKLYSFVNY